MSPARTWQLVRTAPELLSTAIVNEKTPRTAHRRASLLRRQRAGTHPCAAQAHRLNPIVKGATLINLIPRSSEDLVTPNVDVNILQYSLRFAGERG